MDDRRCFDKHVFNICKKIANQFKVTSGFPKLIPPRLYYYASTKHLQYPTSCIVLPYGIFVTLEIRIYKLEILTKRILRIILNDKVSSYGDLSQRIADCSLSNKRIQNMLILSSNAFILNSIRRI